MLAFGLRYFTENLVAVVFSEAEQLKDPFTVDDLATRLGIGKDKPLDNIESALKHLCGIGIVIQKRDRWLLTEFAEGKIFVFSKCVNFAILCYFSCGGVLRPPLVTDPYLTLFIII